MGGLITEIDQITVVRDEQVGAVVVIPGLADTFGRFVLVDAPGELAPIRHLLMELGQLSSPLARFGRAVLERWAFGLQEEGFDYARSAVDVGDVFEGVKVYDFGDEVFVSERAFERLMARFYAAVVEGARLNGLPETPEWQEVAVIAEELRRRAAAGPGSP